jgi:hypothetical protein
MTSAILLTSGLMDGLVDFLLDRSGPACRDA